MRMLTDQNGNVINGTIVRPQRIADPTEMWVYRGAGEWAVHRLIAYNHTTLQCTLGEVLRTEHKLR